MVYTEYFANGTQPTSECDLHPSRGIFGAIASVFRGDDDKPPAPRLEDTGLPPSAPATVTAADTTTAAAAEEQPKKKRGFWSRVFGGGRDDDSETRTATRRRDRKQ